MTDSDSCTCNTYVIISVFADSYNAIPQHRDFMQYPSCVHQVHSCLPAKPTEVSY